MRMNLLFFAVGLVVCYLWMLLITDFEKTKLDVEHYIALSQIREHNVELMYLIVDFNIEVAGRCEQFWPYDLLSDHPSFVKVARAAKYRGRSSEEYAQALNEIQC